MYDIGDSLHNAMDELLDEMERIERKDRKYIRVRDKVKHLGYRIRNQSISPEIVEFEPLPISEKVYTIRIDDKDNGIYVPEEEAYNVLQACSASLDQVTYNLMFWSKEPNSNKYTRTLVGKPALIVESELLEMEDDDEDDEDLDLDDLMGLFGDDQTDFEEFVD